MRAALTRFVPGVLAFFGAALVITAERKGITLGRSQVWSFAAVLASFTAGYVVSLGVLRKNLRAEADILGSRSALAGFTASVILLGFSVTHRGPVPLWLNSVFAFTAGVLTTTMMFGPWIASRAAARASRGHITAETFATWKATREALEETETILQ